MGLRDRLQVALRPGSSSIRTASPQGAGTTSTTGGALSSGPPQAAASISEQLWNKAYKSIEDRKIVSEYVSILSKAIGQQVQPSLNSEAQLQQLLSANSVRAEQARKRMSKLENVKWITKFNSTVAAGLQGNQAASIAWSAVCVAFEFIGNAASESKSNEQGIDYVVERLEFNNKLSELRLAGHPDELRAQIEKRLVTLYEKILLYLMTSACYYHQHSIKTFLKDTVKVYDWDDMLKQVKDAETAVNTDDTLYKAEQNTTNLKLMAETVRTKEDNECLRQLRITDPRDDKKRIEQARGGLLVDAYDWVLTTAEFQAWQTSDHTMWIHGDPGKGKTMLLCGIINELSKTPGRLAYFFCEATDSRLNSAVSVLRGLLYLMASTDPAVLALIREKYDQSGASLFSDSNAWIVLQDMFVIAVQMSPDLCLVVDALDECSIGRDELLDLIARLSSSVKWTVSSRNWPEIKERLNLVRDLSLEINETSVAAGVEKYIDIKVAALGRLKHLSTNTVAALGDHLMACAEGTYLYVALVCRNLEKSSKSTILSNMRLFPKGLEAVYQRMFDELESSELASTKRVLAIAAVVFRPITIAELMVLAPSPDEAIEYEEYLIEIISRSGFLIVKDSTVSFVHLSAKEFVTTNDKTEAEVFPDGRIAISRAIWQVSAEALIKNLHRNMYNLVNVGAHTKDISPSHSDGLDGLIYSCLFALPHFRTCLAFGTGSEFTEDEALVTRFFQEAFVYWLESLILLDEFQDSVAQLVALRRAMQVRKQVYPDDQPVANLETLIPDALRFITYCSHCNKHPLQLYSTLFFSPADSLIRRSTRHELPTWLTAEAGLETHWPGPIMSLELSGCTLLEVSRDEQKIVSCSGTLLEVRDATNGHLMFSIELPKKPSAFAISPDSKHLAIIDENIVNIYSLPMLMPITSMMVEEQPAEVPWPYVPLVTYIGNSEGPTDVRSHRLLSVRGKELRVWDASYELVRSRTLLDGAVKVAVSPNFQYLAITSTSATEVYRATMDETCLWSIPASLLVLAVVNPSLFTPNGKHLIQVDGWTIGFYQVANGACDFVVQASQSPTSLLVLRDKLLVGCEGGTIFVHNLAGQTMWHVRDKALVIRTLASTNLWFISSTFSSIDFWDLETILGKDPVHIDSQIVEVESGVCAVSSDGKHIAYTCDEKKVCLWTGSTDSVIYETLGIIYRLSFSCHGQLVCQTHGPFPGTAHTHRIEILDLMQSSKGPKLLEGEYAGGIAFSQNGDYACYDQRSPTIVVHSQARSFILAGHIAGCYNCVFSPKGILISIGCEDMQERLIFGIRAWNVTGDGSLLFFYEFRLLNHYYIRPTVFSPSGHLFGVDINGQLQIRSPETWELVETQDLPEDPDFPTITYSVPGECFRTPERLLTQRKVKTRELFIDRRSVFIDDVLILKLPFEYDDAESAIRGNRLIHFLRSGKLSVLDIDIDGALADQRTRK